MPYKTVSKQRAANRKSYRKYRVARLKAIEKYRKNHPQKLKRFQREWNWRRTSTRNLDGTIFQMANYRDLLRQQKGFCAIKQCSTKPSDFKRIFDVDHDHQTHIVRGLLCAQHNKVLGLVNDSIDDLQKLINYLQLHKSGGEKQL